MLTNMTKDCRTRTKDNKTRTKSLITCSKTKSDEEPSEEWTDAAIKSPHKRKQEFKSETYHDTNNDNDNALPFPELVESNCSCDGPIKCGKCRFRTDSEAEIILHSINHTFYLDSTKIGSKIKCPTCDQPFPVKNIKRHVYIHTSEKPFKCKTCFIEFTGQKTFKNHEISHKNISKRTADQMQSVTCDLCSASFSSSARLRKHSLIHSEDRPKNHSCDICGDNFYDKETLKTHVIRLHEPKDSRRFRCEFEGCRYTTLYNHQLLEHQKVHSDDKPFVCDQCQYSAKSKWTFKKHYRKHTLEKPFKCQICEYAASLSSNLTRHMRIHTGSKPFKCPYCDYSCNNHENLRKHVLSTKKHAGLFLYKCQHCLFHTNVFSELRQHTEEKHKDIYTIEEIDRMISSIYHKNEDNAMSVANNQQNEEENKEEKHIEATEKDFQYLSELNLLQLPEN